MANRLNKGAKSFEKLFKREKDFEFPEIDYADIERREKEEEEKKRKIEKDRIYNLRCPVCKSQKKNHDVKRGGNGIIGPGYSSWIISESFICLSCGVMYKDISKIKE